MTSTLKRLLAGLGLVGGLLVCNSGIACAQSTIFNIPSTDVVAKKKVYLEFDFVSHLESHEDGGFQGYVPRAVVGIGHNVEIGSNFAFLDSLVPEQPVEWQPNIKWQFVNNEAHGVAATFGAIGYIPIAHTTGADTFGFFYTNVSKKFKADYGPRISGGGYILAGRDSGYGAEGGAMVGYEQPLSKKVSFVADWFSGHNRFGYVTPGFSVALPKNSLFNIGYSIGNQGRKNNALFVYFGITL
jgi:hypothetical protein